MQIQKVVFMVLVASLLFSTTNVVSAADFGWMRDLNTTAEADPSGYKTRLSNRFNIGETAVNDVLHVAENPADAYMLLRLGEMSSTPTDQVIQRYNSDKDKGWGALAKSLNIKPGSPEFHALKNGDDIDTGKAKSTENNKVKEKKKEKVKGKDKGNNK